MSSFFNFKQIAFDLREVLIDDETSDRVSLWIENFKAKKREEPSLKTEVAQKLFGELIKKGKIEKDTSDALLIKFLLFCAENKLGAYDLLKEEIDKFQQSFRKDLLTAYLNLLGAPQDDFVVGLIDESDKIEERYPYPSFFFSSRKILTPEQVLALHRAGKTPPIGSFIRLAGGVVEIGNTFKGEGSNNEKPVHRVKISPFFISPYPVTNAEFRKFIETKGYRIDRYWSEAGGVWKEANRIVQPNYWEDPRFNQPNQPVVGVSYYETEAYLNWAKLRFPTEHEWEYAARGGLVGKRYPWGNEEPTGPSTPSMGLGTSPLGASRAHFNQPWETGAPLAVNDLRFAPNGFGLYQMAGNVWEWVLDWYVDNYYQTLASMGIVVVENPKGPESGSNWVIRGGSWYSTAGYLRVAYRNNLVPDGRDYYLGFRAARTP